MYFFIIKTTWFTFRLFGQQLQKLDVVCPIVPMLRLQCLECSSQILTTSSATTDHRKLNTWTHFTSIVRLNQFSSCQNVNDMQNICCCKRIWIIYENILYKTKHFAAVYTLLCGWQKVHNDVCNTKETFLQYWTPWISSLVK